MKYLILTTLILTACGRGHRGHPGYNGKDGADGDNGTIIQVLRPCDPNSDVLLKLDDGTIVGNYDGGPHDDRLVAMPYPASYGAHEGFSCEFDLDASGNLE